MVRWGGDQGAGIGKKGGKVRGTEEESLGGNDRGGGGWVGGWVGERTE